MKHFVTLKRPYFILLFILICSRTTPLFAQLMPVDLTGYNQDVIANGTAGVPASITLANGFDNAGWSFVAQDYNGTTTCALPMSRVLNSAITTGLTYKLAPYTSNNALHFLTAGVPQSLSFVTSQSASTVYVLGASGSGTCTADIKVNFLDGSSQTFSALAFPDWFNTTGAVNAVGRANINNSLECGAGGPNLAQMTLTLDAGNVLKPITGITVTKAGTGILGILAVSINYTGVSSGGPATVPPIASYAYNDGDTIWINNPRTIVNTSNGAARSYWDILGYNANSKLGPFLSVTASRQCKNTEGINDCFIDTTNQTGNFKWTFTSPGFYRLKVTAINQYGNDTYIDTIYVDTPSSKPHTEFFIDKQVIGVNDFASCFDLSTNGPTKWYWYMKSTNSNPNPLNPNKFTPSTISQNPNLNAFDGGTFDLCLVTENARGRDTLCKKNHVRIIPGYPICAGQSAEKDTIARDQEGVALLSTVGGTYIPSLIGSCAKGFTVATCSDTVVMYVERFKMRINVSGTQADSLLVHQGTLSGPVIARFGGLGVTIPANQRTFKVPGGIAYFETKLANTTGLTGDSGYSIRWSSVPPTYTKPRAAFSMPDTVYDKYTVQYINQSAGVQVKYAWDTNGDNVYGLDNPSSAIDSTTTNPTRTFNVFAPYTAKVCLKAYNCVGADTACKQVRFLTISTSPVAEFTVNRTTGFTTDTFRFSDRTQNGAISWSWTFVPNNVAYLNGTTANSQNPVVLLNSATSYDITLTSTNPLGSNTITKLSYATAIAFNSPGCSGCPGNSVPSTVDVGISRVTLANMDTATALSTPIYHALYNVKTATLYRGVTYTLSTARTTNVAAMNTRAWIDFNHNTSFGEDPIETIISEDNQYKAVTTGTFKVPDNAPLGNTRMRIGVTLGGTTITQSVTTLGCYEDYGILIGIDAVKPILTLRGSAIEKVEVNKVYTDSGVVAFDNLEGDISSRFQVIGTVDITKVGYYTLKYIVADLYGNVSDTAYRTVQVEVNQTGPTVLLNGDDSVYVDVYTGYTELGATAQSNTGVNLTSLIIKTGTVDTSVLGTYVVNYSITDQFNFTDVAKRWVFVQDTMKPTINSNAGTTTFNHQVGLPYLDPIVVNDNYWTDIIPTRTGIINPDVPGSYNLQYNAVDGSGNVAATYYAVVVVKDLVAPKVILLGANPMTVDVFTTFNDPGVNATDNYYPNVTIVKTGVPSMNILGTFVVTYTVTDGAGNSTVVTRTVNVVDRTAPVIQLMGSNPVNVCRFTQYVDAGVKLVDNYYSDDVLQGLLVSDFSSLDMSSPGIHIVYFSLTDPSGNKSVPEQRYVNVVEEGCLTGIKNLSGASGYKVYPNPSNGEFSIINNQQQKIKRVAVMDVLGKVVYSQETFGSVITVKLSDKTGVYQLLVEDENGEQFYTKIVVE
jgi:PKD repeat protein